MLHSFKFWVILVTVLYIISMMIIFVLFRNAMTKMKDAMKEAEKKQQSHKTTAVDDDLDEVFFTGKYNNPHQ